LSEPIRYEKTDSVARIGLDDGKANAMSVPWFDALGAALDRAEADGAGAIVIAGRAGFFSGGLDLKLLPTLSKDELRHLSESFARVMLRVHGLGIPTVAAVTGHAIAGGAVLAMACDARVLTAPWRGRCAGQVSRRSRRRRRGRRRPDAAPASHRAGCARGRDRR